jgi:hypothetical protein
MRVSVWLSYKLRPGGEMLAEHRSCAARQAEYNGAETRARVAQVPRRSLTERTVSGKGTA